MLVWLSAIRTLQTYKTVSSSALNHKSEDQHHAKEPAIVCAMLASDRTASMPGDFMALGVSQRKQG